MKILIIIFFVAMVVLAVGYYILSLTERQIYRRMRKLEKEILD
jgi:hypothetical protein